MITLTCPHCGRKATIDNPDGWVCACELETLKNRIAMLTLSLKDREMEFISTMQQKTRLLPAVDGVLAIGEQAPTLSQDLAIALERLSDARQAAS